MVKPMDSSVLTQTCRTTFKRLDGVKKTGEAKERITLRPSTIKTALLPISMFLIRMLLSPFFMVLNSFPT